MERSDSSFNEKNEEKQICKERLWLRQRQSEYGRVCLEKMTTEMRNEKWKCRKRQMFMKTSRPQMDD